MPLETIKDFDFGVGGSIMVSQRVCEGPKDVCKREVDLIVWLLLEQEFRRSKRKAIPVQTSLGRTQHDGYQQDEDEDDGDDNDAPDFPRPSCRTILSSNHILGIARQYAENTLREVGLDMLLETLPESIREGILLQLCRSCDLFQGNRFRSVEEIFHTIRSACKFASQFHSVSDAGRGQYGCVYHVRREADGQEFAIKKISCSWEAIQEDVKMAINESNILKILRGHQNIISMYDSWLEIDHNDDNFEIQDSDDDSRDSDYVGPLKFYIQLEYCHLSLDAWKSQNYSNGRVVPVPTIRKIAFQLFDGIAFIHSKNILHLDINPKNLLWKTAECNELKIVDFGLAVINTSFDGTDGKPGTLPYVPPELTLTEKSDIYSASITIIEIGKTIYTTSELSLVISTKPIDIGDSVLDNFLNLSLEEDPSMRPSALQFKHNLLPQLDRV